MPSPQRLKKKILEAIGSGDLNCLKMLDATFPISKNIDDEIISIEGITLNPLGYAVWTGQVSSFVFLHKSMNACIKAMERILDKSDLSSLHIICAKGHLAVLKYYLPFYIEEITEYPEIQEFGSNRLSSKPFEDSSAFQNTYPKYLPIHMATIREDIPLLSYLNEYFVQKSYVPRYLDMEYKEETTGENCVLIACRFGNYKMLIFFHKHCKLNFRVKNFKAYNAINVLIEGSIGKRDKSYLNCLRYLVENVGLDIEYNYQFSLATAEDPHIIKYIEFKLNEIGNHTRKADVKLPKVRFLSCEQVSPRYLNANSIFSSNMLNLTEFPMRKDFVPSEIE